MSSFSPIGNQQHVNSDSFWPSFTDIMMVVVMIFLFATSILIVRNYHLVAELQDSLAAEKRAEEVIETTSLENANLEIRLSTVESEIANATQENATLEERLTNYEQENSLLRLQVLAKNEQIKRHELKQIRQQQQIERLIEKNNLMLASITDQERQLTDNKATILALNTEKTQIQNNLSALEIQLASQIAKTETQQTLNDELNQKNTQLSSDVINLQNANNITTEQLNALSQLNEENQLTINLLKEEKEQYNAEILTLKGEYDIVKAKYQKLIKPARSAKGKYIAEVHYVKSKNKDLIRYKEPADADYEELTLTEVEKKLETLKEKYGLELYVKIIIPKNSGLTYNEAWSFMKGLLDKYDYYYQ